MTAKLEKIPTTHFILERASVILNSQLGLMRLTSKLKMVKFTHIQRPQAGRENLRCLRLFDNTGTDKLPHPCIDGIFRDLGHGNQK